MTTTDTDPNPPTPPAPTPPADAKQKQGKPPRQPPQTQRAQPPSVGRVVHYIDREMALHAAGINRRNEERGEPRRVAIEPFAAMITRVHFTDGEPNGMVGLCVFHPELGAQVKLDVAYADQYTAAHWSWPVYVSAR